jgi:L-threonylcarbamoyladenylate synthase
MSAAAPEFDSMISRAADLLRSGRLIAFPTETVYGLGADATNPQAVGKIFSAKGRPATNPLIVHVSGAEVARRYAKQWPQTAQKLAEAFWPGALTLVLPKVDVIVPEVTAGLTSVGLRVPDHRLALALLRRFDGPVAAPSANRANRVSPTTAEHVRSELGDTVDLILDGGPCHVGIESTVLDLTSDPATILRPGGVSREQIEKIVGPVRVRSKIVEAQPAASPGLGSVHYAPNARAWRFTLDQADLALNLSKSSHSWAAILLTAELVPVFRAHFGRINLMPGDPNEYARRFYSALREADQPPVSDIVIELPPDDARWTAVRDRLGRATRPLKL